MNEKQYIHKCEHNTLNFEERWKEFEVNGEYIGSWELSFICMECGKSYDWDNDFIIKNYKIVKKIENE